MGILSKLQISSKNLIRKDDLLNLRGGSGSCCICYNGSGTPMGYMAATNSSTCTTNCGICGWVGSYGNWTTCST